MSCARPVEASDWLCSRTSSAVFSHHVPPCIVALFLALLAAAGHMTFDSSSTTRI